MTFEELVEQGLDGWKPLQITEVYALDCEGRRKMESIAFFKDPDIAKAFVQNEVDPSFRDTSLVWVLTDGKDAILLGDAVELSSDEEAELELQRKIRAKLTDAELRLLGRCNT